MRNRLKREPEVQAGRLQTMQMSPEELARRRAAANPPKDPDAELLETGEEEVFSRTEVEAGRIEHAHGTESRGPQGDGRSAGQILHDEAQTARMAPDGAAPGEPAGGE